MDNLTLVRYLNTFCNWIINISCHNQNNILVCDSQTRSLFFLIHHRKMDERDSPFIELKQVALLTIEYHEELLNTTNISRHKQIKRICKEIYPFILEWTKKLKINLRDESLLQSTLLFEKSTKLINKYIRYYSCDIVVEEIDNYL